MKRGAIIVVAARGAYTGKPRPALVVQSDLVQSDTRQRDDLPDHHGLRGRSAVPPLTASWAANRAARRLAGDDRQDRERAAGRHCAGDRRMQRRGARAVDDGLRRWLGLE